MTVTVFPLPLTEAEINDLMQGNKIKKSFVQQAYPKTVLVILWNRQNDKLERSRYQPLVNNGVSIATIAFNNKDLDLLHRGKEVQRNVGYGSTVLTLSITKIATCPKCHAPLKKLSNGQYQCQNESIIFCEHVLNAKYEDARFFNCGICKIGDVEKCDCLECDIFCRKCQKIIFISCDELHQIMKNNEAKQK
ncbi:MAG: hypothetical protein WC325_09360 [Candidatus Bathyarchaeia archaeon]